VPTAKEQTLVAAAPQSGAAPVRRRVPALFLGLGGAAIAIVYGLVGMKMRFGPPLVMIGLGGLTLVLAGLALWRVIDPLSRADLPMPTAPRAPQRLRELEREKQLVLKAIKEIEFDYQMRKIAEPHYKEMIERYRGRAMRLIGELEAGDNFRPLIERELKDRLAALAAAPEGQAAAHAPEVDATEVADVGVCPACGTRNDGDARFCKKCGGKLGTS
jgi:ribosomal protein L40E